MKMLVFKIQGRESEPYEVKFWRNGSNVTTSCSCKAGQYKYQCKHRIQLLMGDTTNLVGNNHDDVNRLRELIRDTDVEAICGPFFQTLEAQTYLHGCYAAKPDRRRYQIDKNQVMNILGDHGFIKGPEDNRYLDVYDRFNSYQGSIKIDRTALYVNVKAILSNETIKYVIRPNGTTGRRRKAIYCYSAGSAFDDAVSRELPFKDLKEKLTKALND